MAKAQKGDLIRITKVPESWAYPVGGIYEVIGFSDGGYPLFNIPGKEGEYYAEECQYEIHRKAGEEDASIYTCDYCETKLGELSCSSRLGGAFCSTECADAYVDKHEKPSEQDAVNSPNHYTQGRFETIEIIEEITQGYSDGYVAYCVGNALKYLARAPFKHEEPTEDLAKARAYINFALERLQTQK